MNTKHKKIKLSIRFVYLKERQWKNFLEIYCSENTKILPLYWHVLLCTLVWLPITIMTICYSTIFYKVSDFFSVCTFCDIF